MKQFFYVMIGFFTSTLICTATKAPGINGSGLPGDNGSGLPGDNTTELGAPLSGAEINNDSFLRIADMGISFFIQIIALFAVLALMGSGILLMFSGGDEEKFKKARTWFIYSLVGVLVSLSAWFVIIMINNLKIG